MSKKKQKKSRRGKILLLIIATAVALWILVQPPPAKISPTTTIRPPQEVKPSDILIALEPIRTQQGDKWLLFINMRVENHAKVEIHQVWIQITILRIVYVDGASDTLNSTQREDLNRAIPAESSVTDTIEIHPEGASHPFFTKKPKAIYVALQSKFAELVEVYSSLRILEFPS